MKYIIKSNSSLLEALIELSPENSRTSLKEWITQGRILVDGRVCSQVNFPVLAKQTIFLGPKPKFIEKILRLVYEDKDFVVIDKPIGLLSVATNFEDKETAHGLLKRYYHPKTIHVIHRLDQHTSGIMLFALSERAREALKKIFYAHLIKRQYIALVEGHPDPSEGTWECYLYEDDFYRVHVTLDPNRGEKAITHFLVEGTSTKHSRLRLTLETGKKNQIRVHCQLANHPVIGDRKYGSTVDPLKRLALHAELLEFIHPFTNKAMSFYSAPPLAFDQLVPPFYS